MLTAGGDGFGGGSSGGERRNERLIKNGDGYFGLKDWWVLGVLGIIWEFQRQLHLSVTVCVSEDCGRW